MPNGKQLGMVLAIALVATGCTVNAQNATFNTNANANVAVGAPLVGAPGVSAELVEGVRFAFNLPPGWVFDAMPAPAPGETMLAAVSKATENGTITALVVRRPLEDLDTIEERARSSQDFAITDAQRKTVAGAPALYLVEQFFVNGQGRQQIEVFMAQGDELTGVAMSFPWVVEGDPDLNGDLLAVLDSWRWK